MKKRILALFFAVLFIVGLFAGCGGNGGSTNSGTGSAANSGSASSGGTNSGSSTNSGSASSGSADTGSSGSGTPADSGSAGLEPNGDCLAAGKYAVDAEGWPVDKYEYELPFTDRDVTLSFFTLCWIPQYLPDGLLDNTPLWIEIQERTGIHLEFLQVTQSNCNEQFAVLLAADEVPDIVSQGQYRYTGTIVESVEEEVFANLYDYKEYMPNYMWEIMNRKKTNQNTYYAVFPKDDMVVSFYSLLTSDGTYGWCLREDLLQKLGLPGASEVNSVDKLHDVLTAFKTNYGGNGFWPMTMYSTFELDAGKMMSGFNTSITTNMTALSVQLRDGKATPCYVQEEDRDALTLLSQWFAEGLITPNYASYANNQDMNVEFANGQIGYGYIVASDATDFANACIDPDCLYQPCARILREPNQTIHYGLATLATGYGTYCLSAKCEELPLAVTWCDYQYSYTGSELITYGVQGYLWDRNENGERYITDWALNHEAGYGWISMIYACNGLMDGGLSGCGEKPVNQDSSWGDHFQEVWKNVDYDDAWTWPRGASLEPEESDEVNSLSSDIMTYQAEWYAMFLEGEQPMSAWDEYIATMKSMGCDRVCEIYQGAYDRFVGA